MTAWSKDFVDTMKANLPIVFGFVLAMAFILLLVTFRSIVVPIKAIILNLLSVGAAYGVLTLVFQDGHGEKLLDFKSVGGITPWLPLFLFVVLFGLSMDYHVFVLSKVRELVDRGRSTEEAVAEGIKSTAGVITGAAAVMVVTFAAFATGSDQSMKQLGVGLAVAILIDATIVRAVLLPGHDEAAGRAQLVAPQAARAGCPSSSTSRRSRPPPPDTAPIEQRRRGAAQPRGPFRVGGVLRTAGHRRTAMRSPAVGLRRSKASPSRSSSPRGAPQEMQSQSFAARAGRWSAQHRKKAILGWFAFVILATVLGGMVGTKTLSDEDTGNGESKRGDQIIEDAGFNDQTGETVLVQGKDGLKVGDPGFTAVVKDVVGSLEQTKHVERVDSPLDPQFAGNVSEDGRSVLVNFEMRGAADDLGDEIEAPLATVAALQKEHPNVTLGQFGDASAEKEISQAFEEDFQKAEAFSLPITLVILLIAFGALVAAGLPLLLGATAVMGTIGLLGPISQLHALEESSSSVVLLVGLAVGVDYSMFYLRREMEERDAGRSWDAALNAAAATSGRAVLVSGLTVMAAMAGMFLAGNAVFVSFGIGTILVVGVAMLGSVTVLPAMLSFLSRKGWTEKGRVPWVAKRRHKTKGESRVWSAILDRVLKRPLVSVVARRRPARSR